MVWKLPWWRLQAPRVSLKLGMYSSRVEGKNCRTLPGKLLGSPGCWNGGLSKEVGLGVWFFRSTKSDGYFAGHPYKARPTYGCTYSEHPNWPGLYLFYPFLVSLHHENGDIFQPHCEHFLCDEYASNGVQTEHLDLKNFSPCNTKNHQRSSYLPKKCSRFLLRPLVSFPGRRWVKYIWLMRVMSWRCVPYHMYRSESLRRPSRPPRCQKGFQVWSPVGTSLDWASSQTWWSMIKW